VEILGKRELEEACGSSLFAFGEFTTGEEDERLGALGCVTWIESLGGVFFF